MVPGELFVLSAPSGAGKTTLIQAMMEGPLRECTDLLFSVSHTTRPPRRGERDGVDYHFVSQQAFQEMIATDAFLEWAEVYNNLYGTSWEEVVPRLERGLDVILDIDVKGAEVVLQRYPEATGVFVMPPSYAALEERLRGRRLDDEQAVSRRLAISLWEIRRYHQYHYVIINDDARRAADALAAIILARRHRARRMRERAEAVVRDFQAALHHEPSEITGS